MTDPILARAQAQGECFLCGEGYLARHRLWDALAEALLIWRWSVPRIAAEWNVKPAEVRWVRAQYNRARRTHRPLPGRKGWKPA